MNDDQSMNLITSRDAQDRCSKWVEEVKPVPFLNEGKHKLEEELDEFVETDSEFDSVSECGGKKRKLGVKFKAEKLNLNCEWQQCNFNTTSLETFVKHVSNHITELDIRITSEEEVYACLWNGCEFISSVDVDIMKHVNFHAFHTKLKCLGTNVRSRTKLPVSIYLN